jgi:hypothetical protein
VRDRTPFMLQIVGVDPAKFTDEELGKANEKLQG